jgi:hypothetical protein
VVETEHFVNDGYGWECQRCRESVGGAAPLGDTTLARFFREGEAEEREPRLSSAALARWKDATRRTLLCARCGIEEDIRGIEEDISGVV